MNTNNSQIIYVENNTTFYPKPFSHLSKTYNSTQEAYYHLILNRLKFKPLSFYTIDNTSECIHHLWETLKSIPANDDELLLKPFLMFESLSDINEIYSWFEYYFEISLYDTFEFL